MSVERLEDQVLALPLSERRAFTRLLDEHRDEIEQPSALARAQESEVREPASRNGGRPARRIPFAEADVKQMFKEIMDERAAKTPPHSRLLSEAINSSTGRVTFVDETKGRLKLGSRCDCS